MAERVVIGDCKLYHGDCRAVLPTLPADSFDAVVTDPPAGIAFMGKEWDSFPMRDRGPLPGGALPQQTPHKHGRGFANGMHIDTTRRGRDTFIAFLTAVMAECLRVAKPGAVALVWAIPRTSHWTATACEDAGWVIEDRIAHLFGSGFPKHRSKLKPACEDWWLCRKSGPKWLGVEACKLEYLSDADRASATPQGKCTAKSGALAGGVEHDGERAEFDRPDLKGRWPANVTLDEEAAAMLDAQSGELTSGKAAAGGHRRNDPPGEGIYGGGKGLWTEAGAAGTLYGDSGGASRFYFVAKASKKDRGKGNVHPTVKSTALMRWLLRLACPAGGRVLDPFMGSGSTGKAAVKEGFAFTGIEREPSEGGKDDSFGTACRRVEAADREERATLFAESAP